MASKEMEVARESEYPVLFGDASSELLEVMRENFGEQGPGPSDFDRVSIPAGGGTTWEVPGLDDMESIRDLEGIIIAWKSPRAYWSQRPEETEGNQPPDCASDEGLVGNGVYGPKSDENPSGQCATCPMNEWGSSELVSGKPGDRGKACKEMRRLYVIRPNSILPIVVTLPPTSIQPVRKYFLRLASKGVPFYGVVTKLGLTPKSDGGLRWAEVNPGVVRQLDGEELVAAKQYSEGIRRTLDSTVVETTSNSAADD